MEAGHQLQDLTFNITYTSMDPKLINEALDACTATGITNAAALRVDSRLTVFGRESHANCAWHCGGACACAQPPGLEGETRGEAIVAQVPVGGSGSVAVRTVKEEPRGERRLVGDEQVHQ